MKKTTKLRFDKLFAVVLTVAMFITVFAPLSSFAEEDLHDHDHEHESVTLAETDVDPDAPIIEITANENGGERNASYCLRPTITITAQKGRKLASVTVMNKSYDTKNAAKLVLGPNDWTGTGWDIIIVAVDTSGATSTYTIPFVYGSHMTRAVNVSRNESFVVSKATCAGGGSSVIYATCGYCGTLVQNGQPTVTTPATGHSFAQQTLEKTTSCGSYKVKVCSTCGYEEIVEGEENHTWDTAVKEKAATCDSDGYTYYACKSCDAIKYISAVPALGHILKVEVTKAPTCTENGTWTATCVRDGCNMNPVVRTVVMISHNNDVLRIDEASCDTPKTYHYKCRDCGVETTGTVGDPLGHDWNEVREESGDCTIAGKLKKTCNRCGRNVEEAIPSGSHSWITVTRPATCTEDGETYKECQKCHKKETVRKLSAYGHNYKTASDDCSANLKCTICGDVSKPSGKTHNFAGEYKNNGDTHVRKCTNSGCNVYGNPQAHTYSGYKSDASGHWQVCSACGLSSETVPHIGTDDGDCTTAVKCDTCGYEYIRAESTHHPGSLLYVPDDKNPAAGHVRLCSRPGCTQKISGVFAHDAVDDGNCLTKDVCKSCGYVVREAFTSHTLGRAVSNNNGTHSLECINPECDYKVTENCNDGYEGKTANCREKAHCSVCHGEYGGLDRNNHVGGTYIDGAVEATVNKDGYTGDERCLGCNDVLVKGSVIPKIEDTHTHVFDSWGRDGNNKEHYRYCSRCGAIDESTRAAHKGTYLPDDGGATHSAVCEDCGYKLTQTHQYTGDDGNCSTSVDCPVCGATLIAPMEHNFSGTYFGNENGHYQTCTNANCVVKSETMPHRGGIAYCNLKASCELCGTAYGSFDGNNHNGGTELRNSKKATTEEEGYTGDTYCLGCNKLISEGSVIEKISPDHVHDFGEAFDIDSTYHWHTCAGCGEISDKAEHTYENGICSACGNIDPEYQPDEPEPLPPSDKYEDKNSGVVGEYVDEDEIYDGNVVISAEEVSKTDPMIEAALEAIANALKKRYKDYTVLDITLKNATTGEIVMQSGLLKITIPVTEGWTVKVYCVTDDGMFIDMNAEMSADGKYVSFLTNDLGRYILVNTKTESGVTEGNTNNRGDNKLDLWIIIAVAVIAVVAVAVVIIVVVKKRRKAHK